MTQYRVVTDDYAGFEVQQRSWWWPFWRTSPGPHFEYANTFFTKEDAIEWIKLLKAKETPVQNLGKEVYRDA